MRIKSCQDKMEDWTKRNVEMRKTRKIKGNEAYSGSADVTPVSILLPNFFTLGDTQFILRNHNTPVHVEY